MVHSLNTVRLNYTHANKMCMNVCKWVWMKSVNLKVICYYTPDTYINFLKLLTEMRGKRDTCYQKLVQSVHDQ